MRNNVTYKFFMMQGTYKVIGVLFQCEEVW
jgi:hypothetical protein